MASCFGAICGYHLCWFQSVVQTGKCERLWGGTVLFSSSSLPFNWLHLGSIVDRASALTMVQLDLRTSLRAEANVEPVTLSSWIEGNHVTGKGLPYSSYSKESACSAGDLGSFPESGRFPWRRKWLPTPVFLPEKSHGQRSLVGYSPWDCKESDTTEWVTNTHNREGQTCVMKQRDTGGDSERQSRDICGASSVWMQPLLGSREGGLCLLLTSGDCDPTHQ